MAAEKKPAGTIMKSELSYEEESKVPEKAELLMKPETNWKLFLQPSPIIVDLLEHLVFISVEKEDFSINENAPTGGYRYFKKTKSFKVCLQDVCSRTQEAFLLGLKKTRLITLKLQNDLIKGLLQDANVTRNQIEDMQTKARECKTLAKDVKDKFLEQEDVLQELVQAFQNAKISKNKHLEILKSKKKEAEREIGFTRAVHDHAEQRCNELKDQQSEAIKSIVKTMNKVPSFVDFLFFKEDATQLMEKITTEQKRNQEMLAGAQKRKDHIVECMKEWGEKMVDKQCIMVQCEFNERVLEACDSSLEEGLETLSIMLQQCKMMVEFFQMIFNLVDFCCNWQCRDLDEDVQLATRAFSIIAVAHLVQLLSDTYATIAESHLMPLLKQVEGLLLNMNRSSCHSEKARLDKACQDAWEAFVTQVENMKIKFQTDLHKMESALHP